MTHQDIVEALRDGATITAINNEFGVKVKLKYADNNTKYISAVAGKILYSVTLDQLSDIKIKAKKLEERICSRTGFKFLGTSRMTVHPTISGHLSLAAARGIYGEYLTVLEKALAEGKSLDQINKAFNIRIRDSKSCWYWE